MEVIHTPAPDKKAATLLARLITDTGEVPVLLLLSGGSWIPALRNFDVKVLSSRVTIGMLDERFHTNPAINNFSQLTKSAFYKKAVVTDVAWLDSSVHEDESMTTYATRYEAMIADWQVAHPEGQVIGTFGMGTDGHTAGVMPGFVKESHDAAEIVEAYSVPETVNEYPDRVTTTPYLWKQFHAAVALVAGEGKCPSLRYVLQCKDDCEQYPAALWHQVPNLTVITNC